MALPGEEPIPQTRIISIPMSDGVKIAAALFLPPGKERFPTLLAASPYRFDNDMAPAIPLFLWRETGPIAWYLEQGYAYIHMDVRGTGRSGGAYRYQCKREQRDLYEVVEWIAAQRWSNGKIGGIGQSYFARSQWFMATQNPPHLACVAPYDGHIDTYRDSAYTGGIPGNYPTSWWDQVRTVNGYPTAGKRRLVDYDYPGQVRRHTLYDSFWRERAAAEKLEKIEAPVFSIGVWSKVDLHLNGNIVGYQRAGGPKKLLVFGSSDVYAAVADYSSIAFHEKYLLPFYDCYLKGQRTAYLDEPEVRYFVTGADRFDSAPTWPPKNSRTVPYYLAAGPTGSVTSLNDGALSATAPEAQGNPTVFDYPNAGWRQGVVGPGKDGRPDPVRRVLTFTTPPLERDLEIAGPIELILHVASSRNDTDFFVKLSEQMPQAESDRSADLQPRSRIVTKGWLRASMRAVDKKLSKPHAPHYSHTKPQMLTPNRIYEFIIAVMPTAYRFKAGSRIRLELANGDSSVTEVHFSHPYTPDKVGRDTIHHDTRYPSRLLLPVMDAS
ncbi:MAG TPA: CocE/NonD family hydrolase [Stellaceae bacterium]|nr:CocE/NonD family hydrolase [Stellaceae bacterium]